MTKIIFFYEPKKIHFVYFLKNEFSSNILSMFCLAIFFVLKYLLDTDSSSV